MKLATFEVETAVGPQRRVGVVDGDAYVDVTAGYGRYLADEGDPTPAEVAAVVAPSAMIDFLRRGDRALDAAATVEAQSYGDDETGPAGARIRYAREEVRLLSPLPRPNTIRDYSVFEAHGFADKADVWYEFPSPYKGNPETVVPPGSDVTWPRYDDRPDFELEIAAIVGKRGRNVAAADLDDYVVGYTIFNDFSARDVQMREMEARLGPAKGKDFANGFGPYLVTADEFDPSDATATVRVNGDRWAQGNVGDMYHSFGDILERAAEEEPVVPGDVLGSGTVAGCCCFDMDRWIDYGDTVELSVDGLGTLTHRIVEAD
jgi:2-keto-4-pentenoate hydratase/2-oxohepta-3-ene-1,7-dioic acid hydratase in catechol pathway